MGALPLPVICILLFAGNCSGSRERWGCSCGNYSRGGEVVVGSIEGKVAVQCTHSVPTLNVGTWYSIGTLGVGKNRVYLKCIIMVCLR